MIDAVTPRAIFFLGGSSDIALATLPTLDQIGTVLFVHYRTSPARIDAVAAGLRHAKVVTLEADVSTEDGVRALDESLTRALRTEGSEALDGFVAAASPPPVTERFHKKPWSSFAAHLDVQVRAPALLLASQLPAMAKRKRGRVVFVCSSYAAGQPPSGLSDYVTAKHAQLGLMRALAAEYAGKNLQINAVSPSMVESQFLRDVPRVVVEMHAENHPLRRNATPADVGPAIGFLLSDAAGYINGESLAITGGAP